MEGRLRRIAVGSARASRGCRDAGDLAKAVSCHEGSLTIDLQPPTGLRTVAPPTLAP